MPNAAPSPHMTSKAGTITKSSISSMGKGAEEASRNNPRDGFCKWHPGHKITKNAQKKHLIPCKVHIGKTVHGCQPQSGFNSGQSHVKKLNIEFNICEDTVANYAKRMGNLMPTSGSSPQVKLIKVPFRMASYFFA